VANVGFPQRKLSPNPHLHKSVNPSDFGFAKKVSDSVGFEIRHIPKSNYCIQHRFQYIGRIAAYSIRCGLLLPTVVAWLDEPMNVLFVMCTQVGPRNDVLDGCADPPGEGAFLRWGATITVYACLLPLFHCCILIYSMAFRQNGENYCVVITDTHKRHLLIICYSHQQKNTVVMYTAFVYCIGIK